MTDSTSNKTWGAFAPVMPSFIRLVAGVIVLVIVEAVVLGFPGISNPITGSTISVANIVVFMLGLVVCFIILKFGTQLADTVDRKSTRLNSSHSQISYAVFCLKKKK